MLRYRLSIPVLIPVILSMLGCGRHTPNARDPASIIDTDFAYIRVIYQPPTLPISAIPHSDPRIQYVVVVEITMDEQGVPISAKAVEGPEAFRAAAVDYALQWRFGPHVVEMKPMKARFRLNVVFKGR